MLGRLSKRLTYGNVMATAALFVALGGTSYAALTLPVDSVGPSQIRAGAVRSAEVKDATLLIRDFKASERAKLRGLRGLPGQTGATGAPGAKGDKGDPGRSALQPLQSGEQITGGFAFDFQAVGAGGDYGGWVTLPIPAPAPLNTFETVPVGAPTATCPGSAAAPSATAGRVCIYPVALTGASNVVGLNPSATTGAAQTGFVLRFNNTTTANSDLLAYGTWAYRAP